MSGYPQDPKQMQAAYSSQQNMMGGMLPQQYGSIPQTQHTQQAQQRISQHYPQSGHPQMYPTPPQQTPQPYSAYGVQHQSSRTAATTVQHPSYSHTGLDQSGYSHLTSQGPVGLPPILLQQTQQSHLPQAPQSHQQQQQQQQIHQLQHPSMNPPSQASVLGSSHVAQQASTQQSHLSQQNQHSASSMLQHAANTSHQSAMATQQSNQTSHQLSQGHNSPQMSHQMGHSLMSAYGNQMTASAPAVAPPQAPTYLPNSKQTPATQTHSNSPQYRAPFPQLSPQMSPRPQMSPHPQMSPRPLMSPAKPPTQQAQNVSQAPSNMSPHMPGISSPNPRSQPTLPPIQTNVKSSIAPSSASSVNTLQALEQMVMPQNTGMEYNQPAYRQISAPSNPLSPLGSRVTMSPSQQHQQWPQHRSQMNGNNHHNMMQMQQQMQPQQQNNASQMMSQLPDLMSPAAQTIQVIPPPQTQQQPTYNYEELTQQQQTPQQQTLQQKSALDTLHKPYENLTSSLASQPSMTTLNNMMPQQQIMSPIIQNQVLEPLAIPQQQTQDAYGIIQTNPSLESNDQSSDLNLLDSYSNSATINTSSMSSTAQKSSIDDSLLSQTTNDNSQNSHVSDNASNLLQSNNFDGTIGDNGGNSLDQDLPCLEPTDAADDFRKSSSALDNDTLTQDLGAVGSDKTDDIGIDFDEDLKSKTADSTMIQKDLTAEMTDVIAGEVTNNVSYD